MVRKSPRKKSATTANDSTMPTVGKVGHRCRVCDGRPLKATCACSLNPDGTRRIKRRIRKATEPTCSNAPTSLPLPTAAPPQTWSSPEPILPVHQPDYQGSILLNLGDVGLSAEESHPTQSNASPTLPTPPPTSPIHPSSPFSGLVDPFLNGPVVAMSSFRASLSQGNNTMYLNNGSDSSDNDSGDSDFDECPSTPSRPMGSPLLNTISSKEMSSPAYRTAREAWKAASHGLQRAPRKDGLAQHGFVSGSMQGSLPLKIKRGKALRPALTDGAKASQRFMREMKLVIDRAERVALETGSWVFVGGQQPQSRSNFVHFSSNAMRTHALEETQQLTNQFSTLISNLREARLNSALTAQRTLRATQTAFESFQAEVKKAMEDKDRQTEYLVGMVQALQQQMGMPAESRPHGVSEDLDQPVASGSHFL